MEVKRDDVKEVTAAEVLADSESVIAMYERKLLTQFARVNDLMKTSPDSTETMEAMQEFTKIESSLHSYRAMRASFEKSFSRSPSSSASPVPPPVPLAFPSLTGHTQFNGQLSNSNQQLPIASVPELSSKAAPAPTPAPAHVTAPAAESSPAHPPIAQTTPTTITMTPIAQTQQITLTHALESSRPTKTREGTVSHTNNNNEISGSSTLPQSLKMETSPKTTEADITRNTIIDNTQSMKHGQPLDLRVPQPTIPTTTTTTGVATFEHTKTKEPDPLTSTKTLYPVSDPRIRTLQPEVSENTIDRRTTTISSHISIDSANNDETAPPQAMKKQLAKRSSPLPRSASSSISPMSSPTTLQTNRCSPSRPIAPTINASSVSYPTSDQTPPQAPSLTPPITATPSNQQYNNHELNVDIEPYVHVGQHLDLGTTALEFCSKFSALLQSLGISEAPKTDNTSSSQTTTALNWEDALFEFWKTSGNTIAHQSPGYYSKQCSWFDTYIFHQHISWPEARRRLLERYPPTSPEQRPPIFLSDLYSAKQREHEGSMEYFKRWLGLFKRANVPDGQKVALAFFIGLKDSVREKARAESKGRIIWSQSVYEAMYHVLSSSPNELRELEETLSYLRATDHEASDHVIAGTGSNRISIGTRNNNHTSSSNSSSSSQKRAVNDEDDDIDYHHEQYEHRDPRQFHSQPHHQKAKKNPFAKKKRSKEKGKAPWPCSYCGKEWSATHACIEYIEAKKKKFAAKHLNRQ